MAAGGVDDLFSRTLEGVRSSQPIKRARGLDVVAQLGKTAGHRTNSFPQESYDLVSEALQHEPEFLPLRSAIAALGHLDDPRAVPLLAPFHSDPNPEIRFSVACALGSFPNDVLSVNTLMALMDDSDDDVRDWATFGVGVLGDHDSLQLRDALCRKLQDSNADVREEAMRGLAKRLDTRVLPSLIEALGHPEITDRVIEAAYTLLGLDGDNQEWSRSDYASALRRRFHL